MATNLQSSSDEKILSRSFHRAAYTKVLTFSQYYSKKFKIMGNLDLDGALRSNCFLKIMIRRCRQSQAAIERKKSYSQTSFSVYGLTFRIFLVLIFITGLLLTDNVNAHGLLEEDDSILHYDNLRPNHHVTKEFSTHSIIRPRIHHTRHKRALSTTREEEGVHASHITLTYRNSNDHEIIVDLQLNEALIPNGHFLRYQNATAGGNIMQNLTKTEIDLCHYQGIIRGNPDSFAALSTCSGVNGIINDGTDTYYIHAEHGAKIDDSHYLFKHKDRLEMNATCGFKGAFDDESHQKHDSDFGSFGLANSNRILRYKRSNEDNMIRGPYNANRHSSFVELVMVVDNKVYKAFGENMKKVHKHCQDIANIVNALYVPLNIFIALVGVVIWNENNEIELSSDGDATLKNFLHYRRKILVQDHPNDNAQLLTKEQFDGGVVGKALKGPICTYEYSGGVSMEHSQLVPVVATTVAHEMGHNFGMEHDTSDCKCVEEKCIMSASSTSVTPRHWSSCSIDQLNVAFSHGMNYCLRNKPQKLFDSPQCGNGFVEAGEQCDCGLPQFCENTCCDPHTCMLHTNASCATGECCDLTTCRPHGPGTKCRSADGECDLPEFCTGESEYCPSDVFKRDTELCDRGNAYCYQGSCRSRTNQCKILWGPSGESSDHCYEKNIDGSRHGNCGYDRINNKYFQCEKEDIYCGMLHCRHLNERLEFGMESVAVLSHSFMNHKGSIIPCRTAIVDLGLQSVDPGLAPNGAKCAEGKMCVNQKCMAVDSLRADGAGIECPENCNDQGICNSKGHCHCFEGFAAPFCSSPGPGGSEDSGPATNSNTKAGFARAMYIFFLGVVPAVSLFLLFTYYWKQNRSLAMRKPTTNNKPTVKASPSRGAGSPPGGLPTSTPSSTDDMNSALLKSPTETDTSLMNNNMFGKFKGFTLKPLPNAAGATNIGRPNVAFVHPVAKAPANDVVPIRSAPSAPKSSAAPSVATIDRSHVDKSKTFLQNGTLNKMISPPKSLNAIQTGPALPPPNPGSNARPIISSPVLENSTCTAKELISPIKANGGLSAAVPVRPAPTVPPVAIHQPSSESFKAPSSVPNIQQMSIFEKKPKDGTIKRLTSFLKKDDKPDSNTIQRVPSKVKPTIDREKLKNIEISAPIPVVDTQVDTDDEESKQLVSRTQSMRGPSSQVKKPNIQSFGSMRQPSGNQRPKSIVGVRPKSPPPRPPAPPAIAAGLKASDNSGYEKPPAPKRVDNEYDDCEAVEAPLAHISEENSPTGSDNIYSVIEERPLTVGANGLTLTPPVPLIGSGRGSNDSMGLLGEIANEIEKRNVDSIYSASTLKKKKATVDDSTSGSSYSNARAADTEYSDAEYIKSNSSTTSSGYLRPSVINTPIARVAPSKSEPPKTFAPATPNNTFSSFKPKTVPAKPNVAAKTKEEINKQANTSNARNVISRTKTPPSLNVSGVTNRNGDSIRKRSPSPNATAVAKTTTTSTAAKPSPSATRKFNKIADSVKSKPAALSKPLPAAGKPPPPTTNITTGTTSNLNRQPSSSGDRTATTNGSNNLGPVGKPKPIAPVISGNRKNSLKSTADESNQIIQSSGTMNASIHNASSKISSSLNNKILNAAARPTASGKASNVASLQQKFETAGVSRTHNTLSTNSNGRKT